jgi:hypothetical protein
MTGFVLSPGCQWISPAVNRVARLKRAVVGFLGVTGSLSQRETALHLRANFSCDMNRSQSHSCSNSSVCDITLVSRSSSICARDEVLLLCPSLASRHATEQTSHHNKTAKCGHAAAVSNAQHRTMHIALRPIDMLLIPVPYFCPIYTAL